MQRVYDLAEETCDGGGVPLTSSNQMPSDAREDHPSSVSPRRRGDPISSPARAIAAMVAAAMATVFLTVAYLRFGGDMDAVKMGAGETAVFFLGGPAAVGTVAWLVWRALSLRPIALWFVDWPILALSELFGPPIGASVAGGHQPIRSVSLVVWARIIHLVAVVGGGAAFGVAIGGLVEPIVFSAVALVVVVKENGTHCATRGGPVGAN